MALLTSEKAGPVRRFRTRVLTSYGAFAALGLASAPLWAWGRPDRALGFAVGLAAGLVRFAWSVRLARRLVGTTPSRYATARAATLAPLIAALALAGAADGIDLGSAAAGVLAGTAAVVAAAVVEGRAVPGESP